MKKFLKPIFILLMFLAVLDSVSAEICFGLAYNSDTIGTLGKYGNLKFVVDITHPQGTNSATIMTTKLATHDVNNIINGALKEVFNPELLQQKNNYLVYLKNELNKKEQNHIRNIIKNAEQTEKLLDLNDPDRLRIKETIKKLKEEHGI